MGTFVDLFKGFKWQYIGLAFLFASLETFRRVVTAFPLEISKASSPAVCMAALVGGSLVACAVLLLAARGNVLLGIRKKSLLATIATAVAAALFFLILTQKGMLSRELSVAAYGLIGIACVVTFSAWISVLSFVSGIQVIVYVIVCCVLGRVLDCIVVPIQDPLIAGVVVLLYALSGSTLLYSFAPSEMENRYSLEDFLGGSGDEPAVFSIKNKMKKIFFPVVGVSLVFFDSGIKALPVHEDAFVTHHPEIALVGNIMMLGIICATYFFASPNSEERIDIKKVAPLLPVCAMFLACYAFVRMFAGGDPMKNIVSMIGTASIGGFISIFITYIAAETKNATRRQKETCIDISIIIFTVSFILGMVAFEFLGDAALYVQIILTLTFVTVLAFTAMVRESRKDETSLEERCEELAQKHGLSSRESEVLFLLASNHSVSSIADQLYISIGTVRAHKKKIYQKLDVHKYEELLSVVSSG